MYNLNEPLPPEIVHMKTVRSMYLLCISRLSKASGIRDEYTGQRYLRKSAVRGTMNGAEEFGEVRKDVWLADASQPKWNQ